MKENKMEGEEMERETAVLDKNLGKPQGVIFKMRYGEMQNEPQRS